MTPAVLVPLRDIDGVEGSFVIDENGDVTVRDLPALFDEDVVKEAGARIATLFEAVSENFEATEDVYLSFDGFNLTVKRAGAAYLVVVSTPRALLQPVKMATNLIARKLRKASSATVQVAPPASSQHRRIEPPPHEPVLQTAPSPRGPSIPLPGNSPKVSPSKRVVHGASSQAAAPAKEKKNDIWED